MVTKNDNSKTMISAGIWLFKAAFKGRNYDGKTKQQLLLEEIEKFDNICKEHEQEKGSKSLPCNPLEKPTQPILDYKKYECVVSDRCFRRKGDIFFF